MHNFWWRYRRFWKQLGSWAFKILTAIALSVSLLIVLHSIGFAALHPRVSEILESLNNYGNILTITIALVTMALILNQIKLADEANRLTPRINWVEALSRHIKERSIASQPINPEIEAYFLNSAMDIFNFLYELKRPMRFSDKSELSEFFVTFIKPEIRSFELSSEGYRQNKTYKSIGASYSMADIQKILKVIFVSTAQYTSLLDDFYRMYQEEVDVIINEQLFKIEKEVPQGQASPSQNDNEA